MDRVPRLTVGSQLDYALLDGFPQMTDLAATYRLQRALSWTSSARTFAGQCPETGERVAVKVIGLAESVHRESLSHRFDSTASVLQALGHPTLPNVLDHGVTPEGEAYLVTAWFAGAKLSELDLAPGDALLVVMQVVEALESLALHGLVHLGIGPDNVLVSPSQATDGLVDPGQRTQLTGWGSSLLNVDWQSGQGAVLTAPNAFTAPELASVGGIGEALWRADLYSVAAMLVELLGAEAIDAPEGKQIRFTGELSQQVSSPEALRSTLQACLQQDPDARPDAYSALTRALQHSMPRERLPDVTLTQPMHPMHGAGLPRVVGTMGGVPSKAVTDETVLLSRPDFSEKEPSRGGDQAPGQGPPSPSSGASRPSEPKAGREEALLSETSSGRASPGRTSPDQTSPDQTSPDETIPSETGVHAIRQETGAFVLPKSSSEEGERRRGDQEPFFEADELGRMVEELEEEELVEANVPVAPAKPPLPELPGTFAGATVPPPVGEVIPLVDIQRSKNPSLGESASSHSKARALDGEVDETNSDGSDELEGNTTAEVALPGGPDVPEVAAPTGAATGKSKGGKLQQAVVEGPTRLVDTAAVSKVAEAGETGAGSVADSLTNSEVTNSEVADSEAATRLVSPEDLAEHARAAEQADKPSVAQADVVARGSGEKDVDGGSSSDRSASEEQSESKSKKRRELSEESKIREAREAVKLVAMMRAEVAVDEPGDLLSDEQDVQSAKPERSDRERAETSHSEKSKAKKGKDKKENAEKGPVRTTSPLVLGLAAAALVLVIGTYGTVALLRGEKEVPKELAPLPKPVESLVVPEELPLFTLPDGIEQAMVLVEEGNWDEARKLLDEFSAQFDVIEGGDGSQPSDELQENIEGAGPQVMAVAYGEALLAAREALELGHGEEISERLIPALDVLDVNAIRGALRGGSVTLAALRRQPEGPDLARRARNVLRRVDAFRSALDRGEGAEPLGRALDLQKAYPALAERLNAVDRATKKVELSTIELVDQGRVTDAKLLIVEIAELTDLSEEMVSLQTRIDSQMEAQSLVAELLQEAESLGQSGSPHQGLELLASANLQPADRDGYLDLRSRLRKQLDELDSDAPEVDLIADGLDLRRGKPLVVQLMVVDDYEVANVVFRVVADGKAAREIPVIDRGEGRYVAQIPAGVHRGKPIRFWAVAADRSGHRGSIGSEEEPIEVRKKRWFQVFRRRDG